MIALSLVRRPQGPVAEPRTWPVPAEGLTIGRAAECGLVLPDLLRMVSRQHARVLWRDRQPWLCCLSANAPVWVNQAVIQQGGEIALRAGDRVRIGAFELLVEALPETPPDAAAPLPMAPPVPPVRRRLDDWFDLETASDPLGPGSPLPEIDELPRPPPARRAAPDAAAAARSAAAEALRDAHGDLSIHHPAVMAGMRAAVFELFERLGPEAVVEEQGQPTGWARWLPVLHEAALWRRHRQRHQRLQLSLDDDFEAVFGRQFKRACEARSRGLAPAGPPDQASEASEASEAPPRRG